MPSREPALYKDKIEVSLDGRQIFYLFFGGAVIIGLVFVLGVMTGRRVEARGHVDRADTQSARDPLAALDRLEKSESLSFRNALMGAAAPTDVEKAIDEIEKRRTGGKAEAGKADATKAGKAEAKADAERADAGKADAGKADAGKADVTKADAAKADAAKADAPRADAGKADAAKADTARADAVRSEPVTRPEQDKPRADRHDGEKKTKKHDGEARAEGKSESKGEGKSESKGEGKSESKGEGKSESRGEGKSESKSEQRAERSESKPESKSEPKNEAKSDGKSEAKTEARSAEAKVRFTLQLSSFQDKAEAEAFLASTKSSGFQAYLVEADVSGKGTFYRVRLGSYRSIDAANDAKAEYEKSSRKSAQVMRL